MSTEQNPQPKRRGAQGQQTRRPRLRGDARDQLRQAVATDYDAGASIRDLATEHAISYGLTWTLLREAKVTIRHRGGAKAATK